VARGQGGASQLLRAAEEAARGLGAEVMRLDTRHDLVEARGLYAKHGYREIAPYDERRYADHWFEKRLISPTPLPQV
jgi:ribosomal protein S18 acetylase RimI-like enzyme